MSPPLYDAKGNLIPSPNDTVVASTANALAKTIGAEGVIVVAICSGESNVCTAVTGKSDRHVALLSKVALTIVGFIESAEPPPEEEPGPEEVM